MQRDINLKQVDIRVYSESDRGLPAIFKFQPGVS